MSKIKFQALFSHSVMAVLFAIFAYGCANVSPESVSFSQSKKQLKQAYKQHNFHTEFYCGVEFDIDTLKILESNSRHIESNSTAEVSLSDFNGFQAKGEGSLLNANDRALSAESAKITKETTQGYTPRKPLTSKGKANVRAKRIEFEHIMPAHRFGGQLECWQNGGRKACVNDENFRKIEAEKRNLVPAIGEINADRSNFAYAESKDVPQGQYGKCNAYTDFKNKRFYPRDEVKGIIARIYLYMAKQYKITLTQEEQSLMESWDKAHPPTEYEMRLLQTQGF
ncbi:endonuclease [Helicobacter cinaedi]|uniref:Extracellular deoxyribonuclease n=1 Tax=Helicobacter cinaedi TaxID=213 RepID=A0A377JVW6_9HELI|nr:endonuclease [Helicobacter cinaedi]STP13587.1 extracellular deoxyribonuclease [Helicobacter cinaedi]